MSDDEASLSMSFCDEVALGDLLDEEKSLLINRLDGWEEADGSLRKSYYFNSFSESISFSNTVGNIAQVLNYYPSILLNSKRVEISTDGEGREGLVKCDFILAAKIDVAYKLMHSQV